jgi:hypothetical protein
MISLAEFDLTCRDGGTTWNGPCLRHGGDNRWAFVITLDEPVDDFRDAKRGVWWCGTKCHEGGQIISGYMLEPGEKWVGSEPEVAPRKPREPEREPERIPDKYREVLEAAFRLYQENYRSSPGHKYLLDRGVLAPEAGYAVGGRFLLSHELPRETLVELDLIWGDTTRTGKKVPDWKVGTDKLGGYVILPYRWRGDLTCLFGRAVDPQQEYMPKAYTSNFKGKWLRGCFNEQALEADRIILVEGAIDALAIMTMGDEIYRLAAAAKGVELTEEQIASLGPPQVVALGGTSNKWPLSRLGPEARLILAFDNDPSEPKLQKGKSVVDAKGKPVMQPGAGDRAAAKVSSMFPGRCTRVVPLDGFKDWASVTQHRVDEIRTRRRAAIPEVPIRRGRDMSVPV